MSFVRAAKDVGQTDGTPPRLLREWIGVGIPRQRGSGLQADPHPVPTGTPETQQGSLERPRFGGRATVLAHLLMTLTFGFAATWLTGLSPVGGAIVLVVVVIARLPSMLDRPRPDLPRPGALLNHAAMALAAVALASAFGAFPERSVAPASVTVAAALLGDLVANVIRRLLRPATRIVVVGEVDSLALVLTRWSHRSDVEIVGVLEVVQGPETGLPDLRMSLGLADGEPPISRIEGLRDIPQWAAAWGADSVVVIPGTAVSAESLQTLGWDLERTATSLAVAGLFDPVAPHRLSTQRLGASTLLVARSSRPPLHERWSKATFDRVLGLALLVLAAPIIAVLCLVIRLDSAGPSLFRQVRVGRDGRQFEMIKLRTMYIGAEDRKASLLGDNEGNGVLFKIHHDPRITRFGHFLRKSSLDELPQLINVVRGHMSLVGPRPALPSEVLAYAEHMHRRYVVRPGMTGLWQVSGRSDLSGAESMDLDLHYVDNQAMAGDLSIMVRTIRAVLGSKGAY